MTSVMGARAQLVCAASSHGCVISLRVLRVLLCSLVLCDLGCGLQWVWNAKMKYVCGMNRAEKVRLGRRRMSLRFGLPQDQGMDTCLGGYSTKSKQGLQFIPEQCG